MNEAIVTEMMRLLVKERLARAERARGVRSAVDHRAARGAKRTKAPRTVCRRSGQAAY
jgi:hypothetical protein